MISNHILQKTVDGLAQITEADFAVMDVDGVSLASTFEDVVKFSREATQFAASPEDSQAIAGCYFFKIYCIF